MHSKFAAAHEYNVDELCEEIREKNPSLEFSNNLKAEFEKVLEATEKPSSILKTDIKIKEISKKNIFEWASIFHKKTAKENKLFSFLFSPKEPTTELEVIEVCPPSIYEQIGVLMRAFKLFKKYEPRTIQILSLLLLLNPSEGKGRLAQINTGEGKTTIVAMLAVIKALAGHKVDIVTSSSELARPQAEELKDFYKMFGLTVSHNGKHHLDKATRYKCDIVYGAASDFQGDILRDEYSKLDTKSGRKCDFAIVDEVDSMLIDGRSHMVMLSSSMPAMNYLEPFYATIWINVLFFKKNMEEIDGKYYLIQKNSITENGEFNFEAEIEKTEIEGSRNDFIKKELLETIKNEINKKEKSALKLPTHHKDLILNGKLEKWIDCAINAAFDYEIEQNYILDKNKVIPVDSDNTGVLQQNMNWGNGLHQFLQIKHGVKITPESLTTNYISNIAYFQRYGTNLFGLTGTLGSKESQELLERTFNVDSVIISPFKVKRYLELTPLVVDSNDEFYNEILDSNMNHLRNDRAVLIITQYIKEANKLFKLFEVEFDKAGFDKSKIRLYKSDQDSSSVKKEVKSGDLIIATNIAGRGTDIKTSQNVEANGGLHVCVCSLPSNKRVEEQNVGRTSRTGNLGTSQIVIQHNIQDINIIKCFRDECEKNELTQAEEEIKKTITKDKIFTKFCKLIDIVPKTTIKSAVEDRFGVWLQTFGESNENLYEEFDKFEKEIREDLKNYCVIKNPSYYVLIGNKFLEAKQYDKAISNFSRAIEIDAEFSEIAYYNRGYAQLAQHCGDASNKQSEIKKAIDSFEMARQKIKNREIELQLIQRAKEGDKNILSEQVSHKMMLYAMQKNAIEQAIGPDEIELNEVQEDEKKNIKNLEEEEKLFVDLEAKIQKFKNENPEIYENIQNEKEVNQNTTLEEYKTLLKNREVNKGFEQEINKIEDEIKKKAEEFNKNKKEGNISKEDEDEFNDDQDFKRDPITVFMREKKFFENLEENIKTFELKHPDIIKINEKELLKETYKSLLENRQRVKDIKQHKSDIKFKMTKNAVDFKSNKENSVIIKALADKHNMSIEIKSIANSLPDEENLSLYEDEIDEFKKNGFLGAFNVSDIKPIDW